MDVTLSGILNRIILPELNVFWDAWYAFSVLSWHLKMRINLRQIIYIYSFFQGHIIYFPNILRQIIYFANLQKHVSFSYMLALW